MAQHRDKMAPYEVNLDFTTGQAEHTIPPVNDPSCLGVLFRFLSYDEGKVGGGSNQTAQFSLVPAEQTDLFGGGTLQTPYAAVLPGAAGGAPTVRGNVLDLGGGIVRPGESVVLKYVAGASITMRVRIERVKLYDPKWRAVVAS